MTICPACGHHNRRGAAYCASCGASLHSVTPKREVDSDQPLLPSPFAAWAASSRDEPVVAKATETSEALPFLPRPTIRLSERGQKAVLVRPADSPLVTKRLEQGDRLGDAAYGPQEGDILAGRYEIIAVITRQDAASEYRARDLCRCVVCGHEDNAPDDAYCVHCGALRDRRGEVRITPQVPLPPERFEAHFSQDGSDFYVISSAPAASAISMPTGLRLEWGYATRAGTGRNHNEDYLDARLYEPRNGASLGLFIVADGLGGQDSGEVASRMAAEAIWQRLCATIWEPALRGEHLLDKAIEAHLDEALRTANRMVYEVRTARNSEMSSTVTLALITGDVAYIANVGDSRTYLWNSEGLRRITKDHSLVERLVDTGEITRDQVYQHPQRNLIYQSIGDRPDVQVDLFQHRLEPDDHLILCSDGLWEMVREEGIEEVLLSEPDPQRAADRLVYHANLAGGEDDISVIVVQARTQTR